MCVVTESYVCCPIQFLWSYTNRCKLLCLKKIQPAIGLCTIKQQENVLLWCKYKEWKETFLSMQVCSIHFHFALSRRYSGWKYIRPGVLVKEVRERINFSSIFILLLMKPTRDKTRLSGILRIEIPLLYTRENSNWRKSNFITRIRILKRRELKKIWIRNKNEIHK